METIKTLRGRVASIIGQMRALLDKAEDEGRSLTATEDTLYTAMDKNIDALKLQIRQLEEGDSRREKVAAEERELHKIINPLPGNGYGRAGGDYSTRGSAENLGFRNIAEYLFSIARLKKDGQLDERLNKAFEMREMSMGTGSQGGYAVPPAFDATLRMVEPGEAIMRPRCTIIPAGNIAPDAVLSFPTLDQTPEKGMYGGVTITHTGEAVTMTETTASLREINMEPKEMSAYITVSDKLLRNWEASGAFITGVLKWAMNGQEDFDFMRGDGVNKALGYINSAAAVSYARAGANAIIFADVIGMLARVLMRGPLCWVASPTTIPQLATLVDAGSHAIWLSAASASMPGTLLGIPLLFNERSPVLGQKGDLVLMAPQMYMVKDGTGPIAASSEHLYFLSNRTVFKLVWNTDGRPWITQPLPLEGSAANTVSPFVVLQ